MWPAVVIVVVLAVPLTLAIIKAFSATSATVAEVRAHVVTREERDAKIIELDRKAFENTALTTALADEHKRSAALEAYANELATSDNRDLDPSDIAGRMRRLLARDTAAEATGDPIRPEPVGEVRADEGATKLSESGDAALQRP